MPDHITALSNLRIGVEMDKHHMDDGEEKLAALDAAIAALRAQPAAATAENIREGDPYDDPAFEELAREHDVWGRASSALCAVFWRAGKTAGATVPDDEWEAFEAWAKPRHYWLERMAAAPDQYSNTETQNVFACWQARAALAAPAAPQERPNDIVKQATEALRHLSSHLGWADQDAYSKLADALEGERLAAPQEQPSDASQIALHWMGEHDVVLKDRAFKQLCALLSRYGAAPQAPGKQNLQVAAMQANENFQLTVWLKDLEHLLDEYGMAYLSVVPDKTEIDNESGEPDAAYDRIMQHAQRAVIRMAEMQQSADRAVRKMPTAEQAKKMGETGAPHSETERLLYEAYCKGHCWAVGPWIAEKGEYYEMIDRVRFAMWRDRAALAI